MAHEYAQVAREEWVSFPGGELEGKRPKALCAACRDRLKREALSSRPSSPSCPSGPSSPSRPLCFQCYRADLDRERAIAVAGRLDTSSDARFQYQLPLEPINRSRLDALKVARADARTASVQGIGVYTDKRRRAQIAARHALQTIAEGLRARKAEGLWQHKIAAPLQRKDARAGDAEREVLFDAIHAAELQLPNAWLPFVVSR